MNDYKISASLKGFLKKDFELIDIADNQLKELEFEIKYKYFTKIEK